MNRTRIVCLCLVALFLVLVKLGYDRVKDDEGMMLVYFIALGALAGFLAVKYVLPWFADAVGTVVFSSGEQVRAEEGLKAAAKLAQGDYEGAIAEHEKTLSEDPTQTHPIAEIANIYVKKLNDPQRALQVLRKHLEGREWPEDDAAFLRFRMVEVQLDPLKDLTAARNLLEQIIADFPNTRHSANAHHKLHEVEQAEYKLITERRTHTSGS